MDALILARIQFAANISFHILFPTISIALTWVLLYFKLRHARDGDPRWMAAYRFWVKIFALTFALGVVSGITMSFQFGTNWPGYMEKVGNVAGPLLAYEVLTAFFLEATFLGIMLFGTGRVSDRVHTLATLLTPDEMRGRVSAINGMFISASNELGRFESGSIAALFTPLISIVSGGIGTILVVGSIALGSPRLRKYGALDGKN